MQTAVWWWPEGRGAEGWGEVGEGGGSGDFYNNVDNKNKVKNNIVTKFIKMKNFSVLYLNQWVHFFNYV